MLTMKGGEPFFFPGGRAGCLLIHGFTGTPKEMRCLGEHLASQGIAALGVRLAGHATMPEDIIRSRRQDWLASVEDGYHILRGACDRIVVVGLSMGGILSLVFGSGFPVAGIVAMGTPYLLPPLPIVRLLHPLKPLLPLLSGVLRYVPKGPSDWHDLQAAEDHLEYPANPVRGGLEVDALLAEMQRCLPSITAPVLLIASQGDLTVPQEHASMLLAHLGSSDKDILWLKTSGHVMTRDVERAKVFSAVEAFVRRVTASSP
jgi:carboxylesterase